jgi:hypothetical protein
MRRTLISLCIAAAYGGLSRPPVLFGVPGLVRWRWAPAAKDGRINEFWTNYTQFGDKP